MPSAKVASLAALCVHYSVLTVVMHISRTATAVGPDGEEPERYKASSAVVVTELGKLLISAGLAAREIRRDVVEERGMQQVDGFLSRQAFDSDGETTPGTAGSGKSHYSSLGWEQREQERELERRKLIETGASAPAPSPPSTAPSSPPPATHSRGGSTHGKRRSVQEDRPLEMGHARTSSASVRVAIFPPPPEDGAPADSDAAPERRSSGHFAPRGVEADRLSPLPHVSEESEQSSGLLEELDYYDEEQPSVMSEVWSRLKDAIFSKDWWRLSVPAVMFVIQNNLQYVAASNLSVPLFQITYQLKILTTALCSVFLLNRTLFRSQWIALSLLTLGVAAVQLHAETEDRPAASPSDLSDKSALEYAKAVKAHDTEAILASVQPQMNQLLGLLAVILACLSSGFASVYFERVLKDRKSSRSGTDRQRTPPPRFSTALGRPSAGLPPLPVSPGIVPTGFGDGVLRHFDLSLYPSSASGSSGVRQRTRASVWIRNIQLSIFGLAMGMFIVSFEGNKERLMSWGQDLSLWYWENIAADEDWVTHRMASLQELAQDKADPTVEFWASREATTLSPTFSGMVGEFFVGFTPLVWLVVVLQIVGGLLNALVIQHADNIAKGFATSVSILLSFAASVVLFSFRVSLGSVVGGILVLGATWLYNQPQSRLPAMALGIQLTPQIKPHPFNGAPMVNVNGSGWPRPFDAKASHQDEAGLEAPPSPRFSPAQTRRGSGESQRMTV